MAKVELATAEALETTAKASIVVGDPNDVTAVKLDKVMADTNSSIEYETVPGPDGVQRAKIVTHLDPAREPAPRVYTPDDVRNPQHTPSSTWQRTRPPHSKESTAHLAPVAKAEGDKLGNTATTHPDPAPIPHWPPTRPLLSHKFKPRLRTWRE
jgi:hypothetical protein